MPKTKRNLTCISPRLVNNSTMILTRTASPMRLHLFLLSMLQLIPCTSSYTFGHIHQFQALFDDRYALLSLIYPRPLSRLGADSDDEEEPLSEDEAHYIGDVELNPDDERAMAMFMTAEDGPKRTLADAVMEKLRAVEGGFTGGKDEVEEAVARTMNPKVVQVYRGCGSLSILEQMDSCRRSSSDARLSLHWFFFFLLVYLLKCAALASF